MIRKCYTLPSETILTVTNFPPSHVVAGRETIFGHGHVSVEGKRQKACGRLDLWRDLRPTVSSDQGSHWTQERREMSWSEISQRARSGSQCDVDLLRHRVPQIPSPPRIMSFPHSIPLISLLLIPDLLSLSFTHVIPGCQHDKSWVWSQTDGVRDGSKEMWLTVWIVEMFAILWALSSTHYLCNLIKDTSSKSSKMKEVSYAHQGCIY